MTNDIEHADPRTPVSVRGLMIKRKRFAVEDVSFAIPRGCVTGMVGLNGAGKTTVIRSILGLTQPDVGTVTLFGHPAGAPQALARIGVVLDQPAAAAEWRVESLGRRLAAFYPHWDSQLLHAMLDRLGIDRRQRVGELSRGQGVKLTLATALAQRPELLILDEPSSGLDPASRREITDVIRDFMLEPEHAVLFSTHITTDLDELADDLIVLAAGRVAYRGTLPAATEAFALARGAGEPPAERILGVQRNNQNWVGLIRMEDSAAFGPDTIIDTATIDDIIIHLGAEHEEVTA